MEVIAEYGCVKCQRWHRKGIDAEYKDHLWHQSKHGTRTRPALPAEVVALELAREIGPLVQR